MKLNHLILPLLCAVVSLGRAADTVATSAATLELDSPKCELSPQLFTPSVDSIKTRVTAPVPLVSSSTRTL